MYIFRLLIQDVRKLLPIKVAWYKSYADLNNNLLGITGSITEKSLAETFLTTEDGEFK